MYENLLQLTAEDSPGGILAGRWNKGNGSVDKSGTWVVVWCWNGDGRVRRQSRGPLPVNTWLNILMSFDSFPFTTVQMSNISVSALHY